MTIGESYSTSNDSNSHNNIDFKDVIISELKKENETLFELHRVKLEEEVRAQMTKFFDTLSNTNVIKNKESQNISYILSKGSRPNTSHDNYNDDNSYSHTRPHTSQGMQIRASLEPATLETMKRPVTVSTTTRNNTNNTRKKHIVQEIYEKMINNDPKVNKKPIFKTSKVLEHPPHLAEKYNVPVFPTKKSTKKKKDLSNEPSNNGINIINISDNDDDKYINQMNRATQLMIRKSESLIKEGQKAKKYRVKRQKQYETWLKSEADNPNEYDNNDNYDDEIVEDKDIIEDSEVPIQRLSLSPLKPLNT